jgi:hypothetical protein
MKSALPRLFALRLAVLLFILTSFTTLVQGQVSFFSPPTYKGGGIGTYLADFNGDGKIDIMTGDGTLNLGNGDGTFKSLPAIAGGAQAVGDFNGDGKPDVLQVGADTLYVLLGNGDGTFQTAIHTTDNAALGYNVAAADLNGDGKADVVGVFNTSFIVYLSNGDGTFAPGVSYSLGTSGASNGSVFLSDDFNGDGKTDVAVLFTAESNNEPSAQDVVFLGNGDGTFQPAIISSGPAYVTSSAVSADFNGDGKLDLVIVTQNLNSVVIQLGNGDGTFQAPTTLSTASLGSPIYDAATGDFNGDGKPDLAIEGAGAMGIYLGNGDGTFTLGRTYYGGAAVVADFNRDGKPDLAGAGEILLGVGNGDFQGIPAVNLFSYSPTTLTAIADFDKNNANDVAAVSDTTGLGNGYVVNILLNANDGTGSLSLAHSYPITQTQALEAITTADVNGDGNPDLLLAGNVYPTTWLLTVLLGNGDGSFATPASYSFTSTEVFGSIVAGDFNNDGKVDLAVADMDDTVAVLLGNGDGTFGAPMESFSSGATSIVSADFNGDGNLDLAAGGGSGLAILLGKGDGTFQPLTFASTSSVSGVLVGDLNRDGHVDLIAGSQVFLGNGDGTFKVLTPFAAYPFGPLADLNGDGILDILAIQPISNLFNFGYLLGKGDGTFGPFVTLFSDGGDPRTNLSFVQAVDMNGDDKPDLVTGSSYLAGVSVDLNTTPAFPSFTLAPSSGSSTSATVAAGSSAMFSLDVSSTTWTGTVNFSCAITPAVSPAPTCTVPASANVTAGGAAQKVAVSVATTAPGTAGSTSPAGGMPQGPMLMIMIWTAALGVFTLPLLGRQRRLPALATLTIAIAFVGMTACGGGGGSTPTTPTPGTPAGTYTATVKATSGTVSQQVALTVVVQ